MRNVKDFLKRINSLLLIALMLLVCCQKVNPKIDSSRFLIKMQTKQNKGDNEYGEIIYKPEIMDTLQLKQNDFRKVYFSYKISKSQGAIEDLEVEKLDFHYAALKNKDSVIPFRVKINEVGEYYIEGFVTDSIVLHEYYGDKSRIITKKIKVSEKVTIME